MGISDSVLIDENSITEIIPQRPPIVMIDRLHLSDDRQTVTSLTVREDNIFCENNKLTEPGLIENIAQSAAARVGYIAKTTGVDVPLGFIAAVSGLSITALPNVDDTIETTVVVENEVIGITIISGTVRLRDEIIASCEMKIFLNISRE
ncbi:MAG TPA: hydroxymyristoyl-ACP dehydratase [Spirochaetota bacterium]